ncbi:MAG TPA: nucleotidyltransferase domain-containing protein [Vineibacter sp.]|nr:nucleotidyltransferase domain-containing protein [Vineibacter sp.]
MTTDLALAREYRRRAEAALPDRIAKVVVIGSRARGNARPDSDWDIVVFVNGDVGVAEGNTLSAVGMDLFYETGAQVQTIALPAERERERTFFMEDVRTEGVVV